MKLIASGVTFSAGDGQVALVLLGLVIDDDDELPGAEIRDRLFDASQWHPAFP